MKKHLFYFLIFFTLVACKKEEKNIIIPEPHQEYKIKLDSLGRIKEVVHHIYEKKWIPIFEKKFSYSDSQVNLTSRYFKSILYSQNSTYKSYYKLNENGLAYHLIDSYYSENTFIEAKSYRYRYSPTGYLAEIYDSSRFYTFRLNFDGLNTKEIQSHLGITYFSFNSNLSKLDINNFLGDFVGKSNTNLTERIFTDYDVLSFKEEILYFDYKLNNEGYVTERKKSLISTETMDNGQGAITEKFIYTKV